MPYLFGQEQDETQRQRGLVLTLTSDSGATFRQAGVAARLTGDRQTLDPRVNAGTLAAEWQGYLQSQADGDYQFFAYTDGQLRVTLNGQTIVDESTNAETPRMLACRLINLEYGQHPLRIEYRSANPTTRLSLFWSGPGFQREPLPTRQLLSDILPPNDDDLIGHGADLYRAHRCAACHDLPGSQPLLPAPALDSLTGYLQRDWLTAWLAKPERATDRRMPDLGISPSDAQTLATYLLDHPRQPANEADTQSARPKSKSDNGADSDKRQVAERTTMLSDAQQSTAERLFQRVGCLACHTDGHGDAQIGRSGLLGGGSLSNIGSKRTANFFRDWFVNPQHVNSDHRMPLIELTAEERQLLATYLSAKILVNDESLGSDVGAISNRPDPQVETRDDGADRELFSSLQCDRCHRAPEAVAELPEAKRVSLVSVRDWGDSCLSENSKLHQPHYDLSHADRLALQQYVTALGVSAAGEPRGSVSSEVGGRQLLHELGCINCHRRDEVGTGLGFLNRVVLQGDTPEGVLGFVTELDKIRPPSLDSAGDKLHRHVLIDTLRGLAPAQREWLDIRMPRYSNLPPEVTDRIVDHLLAVDRVPNQTMEPNDVRNPAVQPARPSTAAAMSDASHAEMLAGARLVTSNGFGCLSCHAIGSVIPKESAPGTRGPNLRGIASRVRQPWFDRFVRNPTRIVPQLEMPSMQVGVSGVLAGDLASQLAAIWKVLDDPDFEPPTPDPVRTLRFAGAASAERPSAKQRAIVVTDVLRTTVGSHVKPFYIGFANRHAMLYDLDRAAVTRWSVGDFASQQTDKKTWFWQAAGLPILESEDAQPEMTLVSSERSWSPAKQGQFLTSADHWQHSDGGASLQHRLAFRSSLPSTAPSSDQQADGQAKTIVLQVNQSWELFDEAGRSGLHRHVRIENLPAQASVRMQIVPASLLRTQQWKPSSTGFLSADGLSSIEVELPSSLSAPANDGAKFDANGGMRLSALRNADSSSCEVTLRYSTRIEIDRFANVFDHQTLSPAEQLDVVPGFRVRRCPLPQSVMPISLTWQPTVDSTNGSDKPTLYFGSLKGRVWQARDTDGDSLEDAATPFSDELASPYGLAAGDDYVDVLTKYGLLRLEDRDRDGFAEHVTTVAAGWGHTDDYHDWAVGLPRDSLGRYFVALPCQQDERSVAAARWRGKVLMLEPCQTSAASPYRFRIKEFASGQRFPMGLALNRHDQLFATDNQGNYNPFNELNHIRHGHHYGFINRLDRSPTYKPRLTRAAIQIPHPWTRSVNGICFLDTPPQRSLNLAARMTNSFGPFEGHVIGCEYDSRRLIRMTLRDVNGTIQGAAYPFSQTAPDSTSMLGPIEIAVAPDGAIYVGSLRDSGWGGANNIGELLRLDPDFDNLPCGLRELSATRTGLRLEFTKPVDRRLAIEPSNYNLQSAFRVSTPVYGGDDQDRKTHTVRRAVLSSDRRTVDLEVDGLAVGRVYEIRIQRLLDDAKERFFPAEAYLTISTLPDR